MASPPGDAECKFPFELVLHIISECSPKGFIQCSLVCRSWLEAARSHQSLVLKTPMRAHKLVDLITSSEKSTFAPRSLSIRFAADSDEQFAEYLSDIYTIITTIGNHIHSLNVRSWVLESTGGLFSQYRYQPQLPSRPATIEKIVSALKGITDLRIIGLREFQTPFIEFICSFPFLKNLYVDLGETHGSTSRERTDETTFRLPKTLERLHFVRLGSIQHSLIPYRWIQAQAGHGLELKHLSALEMILYDVDALEDHIHGGPLVSYLHVFPGITSLYLSIDEMIPFFHYDRSVLESGDFEELARRYYLDLSVLQSLEELTIYLIEYRPPGEDECPAWAFVHLYRYVLESIASSRFQRLNVIIPGTMVLSSQSQEDTQFLASWNELDAALSRRSNLQITFLILFNPNTSMSRELFDGYKLAMKTLFRRAHDEGLVKEVRPWFRDIDNASDENLLEPEPPMGKWEL